MTTLAKPGTPAGTTTGKPALLVPRTVPVTRPTQFRMLVYGASGLGKTTFAADLHGPDRPALTIYTTAPGNYSAVQDRPHLVAENLSQLEQIVERADFAPFDCVSIDDDAGMLDMIYARVTEDTGKDFEANDEYGKWGLVRTYVYGLWTLLSRRARNVCLICSESDSKTVDPTIAKSHPGLPPNVLKFWNRDLDLIGRATPGRPTPAAPDPLNVVSFVPAREWVSKDRYGIMGRTPIALDGRAVWRAFHENPWTPRSANTGEATNG